eukprot:4475963-Pleurochrysis_carterae.AAC.1
MHAAPPLSHFTALSHRRRVHSAHASQSLRKEEKTVHTHSPHPAAHRACVHTLCEATHPHLLQKLAAHDVRAK